MGKTKKFIAIYNGDGITMACPTLYDTRDEALNALKNLCYAHHIKPVGVAEVEPKMITTFTIADKDLRCEFCNDRDAKYRFGDYGKGICEECLEAIRGK